MYMYIFLFSNMNLFRNYKLPSFALTGNFANYDLLSEGRKGKPASEDMAIHRVSNVSNYGILSPFSFFLVL